MPLWEMRKPLSLGLAIVFLVGSVLSADTKTKPLFDLDAIRDTATLEVEVLQDWQPAPKDKAVRQKLIEITVCEWWPGQKVRLPVTLNAPADQGPCRNVIVANQGLVKKAILPKSGELELLKEHGVGVVLIGMSTIDMMEPKGELHLGMQEKLLETKDPRYTVSWIWGMSQMRALTAAMTEPRVFRPERVLATGGSKRGVASAAAGIHDDRFTAILPVVAPPLGNPGTDHFLIGAESERLQSLDAKFYGTHKSGVEQALRERAERRAKQRVTLEQAREAGWTDADVDAITDRAWDASRIVDQLDKLEERGLEIFYNFGTNDSVSPALIELGEQVPDFPICIIPGGQHGGPATAGFTRQVPLLPEVQENLTSFARHHFFGDRGMPKAPQIESRETESGVEVLVTFPDGIEPERNELWWSFDRNPPYTLSFEYDHWDAANLERGEDGNYTATIPVGKGVKRIDFLSLHTHTENGLPITFSSCYWRVETGKSGEGAGD